MNQRVPDSSGLPLRAMVMVLLFLAVIFLLLGLRALGSGGENGTESTAAMTTTSTTTTTTTPAPVKPEVHVFNASEVPGLAGDAGRRLTDDGWNAIVEQGTIDLPPDVALPAVFFTDGNTDETAFADDVAQVLQIDPANVIPRKAELPDPPPGIIVVVTG